MKEKSNLTTYTKGWITLGYGWAMWCDCVWDQILLISKSMSGISVTGISVTSISMSERRMDWSSVNYRLGNQWGSLNNHWDTNFSWDINVNWSWNHYWDRSFHWDSIWNWDLIWLWNLLNYGWRRVDEMVDLRTILGLCDWCVICFSVGGHNGGWVVDHWSMNQWGVLISQTMSIIRNGGSNRDECGDNLQMRIDDQLIFGLKKHWSNYKTHWFF